MARGRRVGSIGSIAPPPGFRWTPKPNARARCMRLELKGKAPGEGQIAKVFENFAKASAACKIKGS